MNSTNSRQITLAEMAPHVHQYAYNENKTEKILTWLKSWIIKSLKSGKIKPLDLLPPKAELSYHMGVSKGTMQNVLRQLENMGYVESKQKVGTFIKSADEKTHTNKLTSKREVTVEQLKKYLRDNNYKINDYIPSIRKLSTELNIPNSTTRLAVMQLVLVEILIPKNKKFMLATTNFTNTQLNQETLVEKTAQLIKKYIQTEMKAGDKIPSIEKLAQIHNVSIKTIHDAIKLLTKQGLLYSRRGTYGTVVLPEQKNNIIPKQYFYEKVEHQIREYISQKCQLSDKLPTIKTMAKRYNTSGKTVKKALDNLIQEGFLTSVRGRYGGIYILDIPQKNKEAYKWLALNAEYIPEMGN